MYAQKFKTKINKLIIQMYLYLPIDINLTTFVSTIFYNK